MKLRTLAFAGCIAAVGLAGCSSDQGSAPPPPVATPAPTAEAAPPPPPPAATAPVAPSPARHMSSGSHNRVAKVQTALNANGAQLTVDGRMGSKTVAALKDYQQQHKLKVTGRPDTATAKSLGV